MSSEEKSLKKQQCILSAESKQIIYPVTYLMLFIGMLHFPC